MFGNPNKNLNILFNVCIGCSNDWDIQFNCAENLGEISKRRTMVYLVYVSMYLLDIKCFDMEND